MHPDPTPTVDEQRRRLIEALLALERADSPLGHVEASRLVRELADRLETTVIREAREAKLSWAKIGASYGLTKQGAQQRFAAQIAALDRETGDSPASATGTKE